MSAVELYEHTVKQMPSSERLRLASMILNDLLPSGAIDDATEWTADDMADATKASVARLDRELGAENAPTW